MDDFIDPMRLLSRKVRRRLKGTLRRQRKVLADMRSFVETAVEIRCKGTGCYGCCRGPIAASGAEADRIAFHMDDAAWSRVLEVSSELENEEDVWCPLLDPETKACSVYKERPLTCRAYHSLREPEACYTDTFGVADIPRVGQLEAVAVHSYFLEIEAGKEVGVLGALLLDRVPERFKASAS